MNVKTLKNKIEKALHEDVIENSEFQTNKDINSLMIICLRGRNTE